MTPSHPAGGADPLGPVRAALLARAEAEAQRLLAEADEEASGVLAQARAEADGIRAAARAQGELDAARELVSARARIRRRARTAVLSAQRDAYAELRARVLDELAGLRGDPGYGAWCDRLRERVQAVLGADARVVDSPSGGVVAEADGRRVECTLVGLADRVIDGLGADVEGLWAQ
ncbi:hypothetical protein [Nocardioides pacificus]